MNKSSEINAKFFIMTVIVAVKRLKLTEWLANIFNASQMDNPTDSTYSVVGMYLNYTGISKRLIHRIRKQSQDR